MTKRKRKRRRRNAIVAVTPQSRRLEKRAKRTKRIKRKLRLRTHYQTPLRQLNGPAPQRSRGYSATCLRCLQIGFASSPKALELFTSTIPRLGSPNSTRQ